MGDTKRRKPRGKERQQARLEAEFYDAYGGGEPVMPQLAPVVPDTVEVIKAEAEAIVNAKAARPKAFSAQAPPTDDPWAGTGGLVWWVPSVDKYVKLADHGLVQREYDLREFARIAPMVLNAEAALTKKVQSLQYFVEAGRNLAIQWQAFFNNVEKGRGWDFLAARIVRGYSESDRGVYVEIVRAAPPWAVDANKQLTERGKRAIERGDDRYWKIVDLRVMDPVHCRPTRSEEFPLIFDNPYTAQLHRLRQYNFMHFLDMPDVDSKHSGIGSCAVSRAAWAATEDNMITRYSMEKMSDNPGQGIVAANVAPNMLKTALKKVSAEREARGIVYYKGLVFLPLLDPSGRFSLELLSFAGLIDGFNRTETYNIHKEIVASAFGLDPMELGALPGKQLGSGKQAGVLAEKSRGKGIGALIKVITRELRHKVLPPTVRFRFQAQDITEELNRAEVNQIYFRNAMLMAKAEVWDASRVDQYLVFKEAIPRSLVEEQTPNIELSDTEIVKSMRYGDLIRIGSKGGIEVLMRTPYAMRSVSTKTVPSVVPAGAGLPLSTISSGEASVTETDVRQAVTDWNERMPNRKGLLQARPARA